MKREDLIHIGSCVATHGIKGEVACNIINSAFDDADPDFIIAEIDGTYIPFFIEQYRWKSDTTLLLKLIDTDSSDDAVALIGKDIFLLASQCNEQSEHIDANTLIDYSIIDQHNANRGKIVNIDYITDENAILLMDNDYIIPLHPDLVDSIDREHKQIIMHLPDGL